MMFVWSKLSSVKWEDAWEERLYDYPNAVIERFGEKSSLRLSVFCEQRAEAEALRAHFGGTVREVKNQNWVKLSTSPRAPLKIRDALVVVAEEDPERLERLKLEHHGKVLLSFPSEMAFGTGEHPTTATCLRMLVDEAKIRRAKGAWICLDLGCGTGILSVAAHHLGAARVLGFDFDRKAVEVAQRAACRNGADQVIFDEQDVLLWKNSEQFDVIVANLFANVLQQGVASFREWLAPEGRLIISGILSEQWEETQQAAEAAGFEIVQVVPRGKWTTAMAR